MSAGPQPGDEILVVEDDERFARRLARAFEDRGLRVHLAHGHAEALALAREHAVPWAVVDLRLPDRSGIEVIRDLIDALPGVSVVMLTGYGSLATALDAGRLGAVSYLTKPADADAVLAAFGRGERAEGVSREIDYRPLSLARAEWEHINRVLADCGGNVSEAARRLGLHRRTLQRKLQTYPPES